MASDTARLPLSDQLRTWRSSSDSVISSSKLLFPRTRDNVAMDPKTNQNNSQTEDVAVQTLEQGTLVVATRAPTLYETSKPAQVIRARHQLQLPSFHALGIANPFPINMLTPPDEPTTINWTPSITDQSDLTSMSLNSLPCGTPSSNTPQTPIPSCAVHTASHDTATQSAGNALITFSVPPLQSHQSSSSESSSATEIPSNIPWLEGAIGVICMYSCHSPFPPATTSS